MNNDTIQKMSHDDYEAFKIVCDARYGRIFRTIYKFLPFSDHVGDVTQIIFDSIWESRKQMDTIQKLNNHIRLAISSYKLSTQKVMLNSNFTDNVFKELMQEFPEVGQLDAVQKTDFVYSAMVVRTGHATIKQMADQFDLNPLHIQKFITHTLDETMAIFSSNLAQKKEEK